MTAEHKFAEQFLRHQARFASLRRLPVLGSLARKLSRRILPVGERVWVEVRGGAGKGLWLELHPRTGGDYYRGIVEPAVQQELQEHLRPGMVFYDVGANIGLFSMIAARLVGPSGKVFVFEPEPELVARAMCHVERNGFSNVTVVEAAVWSKSGSVRFVRADTTRSPERGLGHIAPSGAVEVRSIALDDFLSEAPSPDVLKCDVEGAEAQVFEGAQKLLTEKRPVIICELHSTESGNAVRALLEQHNYRLSMLDAQHLLALPVPAAVPRRQVIALLGRRDEPTDAIEEYCHYLGEALKQRGCVLQTVRVPWAEQGWRRALAWLRDQSENWRCRGVLLHYAPLAWSKRGFPVGFLRVLRVLRRQGIRCAVVFHDVGGAPEPRLIDRIRRACQAQVMRSAYERAERSIFAVPPKQVRWLPVDAPKAVMIPVGANLPAPDVTQQSVSATPRQRKTVAVFGITGDIRAEKETGDVVFAVTRAANAIPGLRLVVLGRGAEVAEEKLRQSLTGSNIELAVLGVLPAVEVSRTLSEADVLCFVRGHISNRRSSAIAGIACGLPVVAYEGPETGPPVTQAGVILVPQGDREALAKALHRVLTDEPLRQQLRQRSRTAFTEHFAWEKLADRYLEVLGDA